MVGFSRGQLIGSMADFNRLKHLGSLVARRYRRQDLGISGFAIVSLRVFVIWRCLRSHAERFALQWVQKYIQLFGGNPQQVIL